MAQIVGYWEDNVVFIEGPFVLVEAGGWRIEVEDKGRDCPILPHLSIDRLLEANGMSWHKIPHQYVDQAKATVDWLNQAVRDGKIVLVGGTWVAC